MIEILEAMTMSLWHPLDATSDLHLNSGCVYGASKDQDAFADLCSQLASSARQMYGLPNVT